MIDVRFKIENPNVRLCCNLYNITFLITNISVHWLFGIMIELIDPLNTYTFHISPYDLALLAALFIGLTFTILLWFTKSIHRTANRFLAQALLVPLQFRWVLF